MSEDQMVVEVDRLPPMIQKLVQSLEADRKKLMKDKGFNDPEQLRNFIGTYAYPRMTQFVKMLAAALADTYELGVSNMNTQRRFSAMVISELNDLGSDIEHDGPLPGVSADSLDDLQQAMYALAALLEKKLPDDKETQDAFNKCAEIMSDMQAELVGEPGDSDRDEPDEPDSASSPPSAEPAAPAPQEPDSE